MPSLRRWLTRVYGIQARFILALALFVLVSMALLGAAVYANQRRIILERLAQDTQELTQALSNKGVAASTFLTRIAPQGILAYDFLLLGVYVEELSADPDIVYIVILNTSGKPITHYLKRDIAYFQRQGLSVSPESYPAILEKTRQDPDLLIVKRSIDYDGSSLGEVEVGLSREKIVQRTAELQSDLRRELRHTALFTGGLILLSLIALIVLIQRVFLRMVVQPLQSLGAQMARLQAGELQARAPVLREDEIGRLARSFNHMAGDLQAQLNKIEMQRCAYKETRDYLANILDNSEDMIATTALDGSIVEFNSAAERILGYARMEIVGQPSAMMYYECAERDRLYASVRSGRAVQNAYTRIARKDGSVIDMELTLSPLRDNSGRLVGAVCIGRDVTQARALQHALIQAEKMASIGQVAAWIAHQIRNSLGSILMAAAALSSGENVSVCGRNTQRGLAHSIAKLDHMVSDLLDYSRTLKLHRTPVNLNSILDDLLNALATGGLSTDIQVERAFSPDLPRIYADVFKLEQALSNVLKNAAQAMPDGGTLRVETNAGPDVGQVSVVIADSGAGIAADDLSKVFLPFFTTKSGGTGLGLAMAARIIEAHGGGVYVESALGRGAKFTLVLPVTGTEEQET